MQVCTSLQTDNHASTAPVSFYRPDALPAAHPTASKQWRHSTEGFWTLDVLRWWCGVCELEWCGVYSCSRRLNQRPACDWRVQWPTYRHVTHCTAPVPPLTTTMMTVMTSTHCKLPQWVLVEPSVFRFILGTKPRFVMSRLLLVKSVYQNTNC